MQKLVCNRCQELFEIGDACYINSVRCPRCSSREVQETNVCMREIGPPPWEYFCRQCSCKFRVKSPSGPDEAKHIKCPICESKNTVWLALVSETCPTGG